MSHFPSVAPPCAEEMKGQVVVVTSVQEGGMVSGQIVSAAAKQTLQFLSCKLPTAELLMAKVDRIKDLDHTLLYGARVNNELVRCQTKLSIRETHTEDSIPVTLIDWGTSHKVTLGSLFHLPQELAALSPLSGWFRLQGCGQVKVEQLETLVGKQVQMEMVGTGLFMCCYDGQVMNDMLIN